MLAESIRPAIVFVVSFTALTGLALPLAMVGGAQVLSPFKANGSIIVQDGRQIGSALEGQNFTGAAYFHGRPSATVEPDPKDSSKTVPTPYAADNSAASNFGPTSKALVDRVRTDVAVLHGAEIPADAVTASGSGLDPDITPENAALQVARVAAARTIAPDRIRALVDAQTRPPLLGFIGAQRVNVLALNLALDRLKEQKRR